jgi:hypothetical protein
MEFRQALRDIVKSKNIILSNDESDKTVLVAFGAYCSNNNEMLQLQELKNILSTGTHLGAALLQAYLACKSSGDSSFKQLADKIEEIADELEQNNISVRDSWKRDDDELAKLLGVNSVIRMNIRKQRYMSDEASYGVGVAKQVIYKIGVGSKVPIPGSVGKTCDIYATCNLFSDNQTLWNDNYKRSTDYDVQPNVVIEWITDDFGENFPYKKKRK